MECLTSRIDPEGYFFTLCEIIQNYEEIRKKAKLIKELFLVLMVLYQ